jgi:hypothetical protein
MDLSLDWFGAGALVCWLLIACGLVAIAVFFGRLAGCDDRLREAEQRARARRDHVAAYGVHGAVGGRCGATFASCFCALVPDHEGPHECGAPRLDDIDAVCLGQWHGDERNGDTMQPLRFPGGETDPIDALIGFFGFYDDEDDYEHGSGRW